MNKAEEENMLERALEASAWAYVEAMQEANKSGVYDTARLVELRDVIASDGHALTVFRQQEKTQ